MTRVRFPFPNGMEPRKHTFDRGHKRLAQRHHKLTNMSPHMPRAKHVTPSLIDITNYPALCACMFPHSPSNGAVHVNALLGDDA